MDIATQTEIVLRDAGYDTWTWTGASPSVTCFENAALIGFVHVFGSADELLARWHTTQQATLSRHSAALRAAGTKAWNVYSVFLAKEPSPALQHAVERLEEDFSLTRKIARAGLRTKEDIEEALLPLTAVKAQPLLSDSQFADRLGIRLKEIPKGILATFLSPKNADEIARILLEQS